MDFHHQNHLSFYSIINHHRHQLAHIHSLCSGNELPDNLIWKRNLHSLFLMPRAGLPGVRALLCAGAIGTEWKLFINEPLPLLAPWLAVPYFSLRGSHIFQACWFPLLNLFRVAKQNNTKQKPCLSWRMLAIYWDVEFLSISLILVCSYFIHLKMLP